MASRSAAPSGLTGPALEALLARLGPDRDRAAEAYHQVRARLVRLFEWRAWEDPEALADLAIDRVARRLAEGLEIRAADPWPYFAGVASLVVREVARRGERERAALREIRPPTPVAEDPRVACLEGCLDALTPTNRRLVVGYYATEGARHIESRAALARDHGMEAGTLRVRVHRLRQGLEQCVASCVAAGGRNTSAVPDTRE